MAFPLPTLNPDVIPGDAGDILTTGVAKSLCWGWWAREAENIESLMINCSHAPHLLMMRENGTFLQATESLSFVHVFVVWLYTCSQKDV